MSALRVRQMRCVAMNSLMRMCGMVYLTASSSFGFMFLVGSEFSNNSRFGLKGRSNQSPWVCRDASGVLRCMSNVRRY